MEMYKVSNKVSTALMSELFTAQNVSYNKDQMFTSKPKMIRYTVLRNQILELQNQRPLTMV